MLVPSVATGSQSELARQRRRVEQAGRRGVEQGEEQVRCGEEGEEGEGEELGGGQPGREEGGPGRGGAGFVV